MWKTEERADAVPKLPRWFKVLFVAQLALNVLAWSAGAWWALGVHQRQAEARKQLDRLDYSVNEAAEEVREWWRIDSRNMWREIDKLKVETEDDG